MKGLLAFLLSLCLVSCSGNNDSPSRTDDQLIQDIVMLAREKVDEKIQLALIKAHGRPVSLNTQAIIRLRNQGVSDRVIERLLTGSLP
ncbi:MAG: hypothetical protein AB7F75_13285 [Planctomycetota bacterium]